MEPQVLVRQPETHASEGCIAVDREVCTIQRPSNRANEVYAIRAGYVVRRPDEVGPNLVVNVNQLVSPFFSRDFLVDIIEARAEVRINIE